MIAAFWAFFVKGGWKWILIGAVALMSLTFGIKVYNNYQEKVETIVQLTEANTALEITNAANEAALVEIQAQMAKVEALRKKLEEGYQAARTRVTDLEKMLNEHDLEDLANKKPGLIEDRINNATIDLFRDLECMTTNCE